MEVHELLHRIASAVDREYLGRCQIRIAFELEKFLVTVGKTLADVFETVKIVLQKFTLDANIQ